GETVKAREALEQARRKHPRRVELWTALATLAEHVRDPKEALRLLDEASAAFKEPADQVELRLARARHWGERRTGQPAAQPKKLEGGLETFPDEERGRLLNGLAEAHYRAGAYKDAGRLWRRLAGEEKYRRDLRLRLVLFDLALQEGQAGEMAAVLKEIRALEGGQGTFGRHAGALALIWAGENGQAAGGGRQKALDDAARLLEQVRAARPSWPAPLLARAEVERLRGNSDQEIESLEEARKLGDRSPLIVRQLVEALRRQG